MRLAWMHTGGECVQPADPVGKPLLDKEFERSVGYRRLIAESVRNQPLQNIIGAHRLVRFQQDFQRAANRCHSCAARIAERIRACESILGAMAVVMPHKGKTGIAQRWHVRHCQVQ